MTPIESSAEQASFLPKNQRGQTHVLKVWGDFACFTRPEMKVERYSYPIITPSAARGIFDAIYFKKNAGFYWQIEKIEMLEMPKYIALRRNEVKEVFPGEKTISRWMQGRETPEPLVADEASEKKGRTQRQTMALKKVCYHLHAHMSFKTKQPLPQKTLDEQFIRRARNGKCFHQPYLGCREFPAWFELQEAQETQGLPIDLDLDLGWMLYDVYDLEKINDSNAPFSKSMFHAVLSKGALHVPQYASDLVRKEGGFDVR